MAIIFWISLFIVFYTYVGYGIVLYILVKIKRAIKSRPLMQVDWDNLPQLTLIVAAYNEADILDEKIANTLQLKYPKDKLQLLFITDGSTDASPDVIKKYPEVKLMHSPERRGKIHAIHRAMEEVHTAIVIFTDANTFLNENALVNIARHYADASVGAVSGEKRVKVEEVSDATAGEGFYWKYESTLKKWDSELYSVVGAAGELFSIRRDLYIPVPADTVLDDFMISMLIAADGYRIVYEPAAYAVESSSENVKEELKRKIRIAAGGIQSIIRLPQLFNLFKYPILSFQYISHRVLRWTITPFLMILALILNVLIVAGHNNIVYTLLLVCQLGFYGLSILGWFMQQRQIKIKLFFIPYYFCVMNYAVFAGMIRYFSKSQSAVWEKARRRAG